MAANASQPVGLIAGRGELPRLVAQGIHAHGRSVCCIGLRGQVEGELHKQCDYFRSAGILQIGKWIRTLKRWGVADAVMVGGVRKRTMHGRFSAVKGLLGGLGGVPDARTINLWYRRLRHDRRNATLLAALADELRSNGITLIDSTTYIADHLASPDVMGAASPTAAQQQDINFAWPLLTRTVELHIGQAMAVRNGDVLAVEAVEGTAAMIARAGELCPAPGWTLLKTASADHDMRADVPSIGVETIDQLKRAGAGCVALGANAVILIDKPRVIASADAAGIAIVGV